MKKNSLFLPIIKTIFSSLWVLIFCADFFYPPELGLLMVLHGLCAVLGIVNTIAQWICYQKDKVKKNHEVSEDSEETNR